MTDQLPSKELTLIQHLIYCVNGCEFNGMPNTADACRKAIAEIERLQTALATANANHERFEREWYLRGDEIERLQTALRGIQSCSTCEACRGAATLALGGGVASCQPLLHLFTERGQPCVCGAVQWGQPSNTPAGDLVQQMRLAGYHDWATAVERLLVDVGRATQGCPCKGHPTNCYRHPHDCGCSAQPPGEAPKSSGPVTLDEMFGAGRSSGGLGDCR